MRYSPWERAGVPWRYASVKPLCLRLLCIRRGGHRARSKIIKHEQANCGRQIALLAIAVDLAHQFGQCHASKARNFLHAVPECLFEADAGLVTRDHDRALHHGRLHDASSPSIRCWSSKSLARLERCWSSVRSDLVRPNRVRLASACFADCSRSLRFLNRFRLTTSPMLTPIMQSVGGMRHFHEGATGGAEHRRIFRPGEIRSPSGKYSRSSIPRVCRSQNHYSHLRNTRQPARSSFEKSPTLNNIKKSPVLQTRNNLCSSTGLRSCDSSAVLFFRRHDS